MTAAPDSAGAGANLYLALLVYISIGEPQERGLVTFSILFSMSNDHPDQIRTNTEVRLTDLVGPGSCPSPDLVHG